MPKTSSALFALTALALLACGACSAESPADAAAAGGPGGGEAAADVDGGAQGPGGPTGQGAATPPVVLPADPATDCPAPYNAKGAGPKAGANAQYSIAGQSRSFTLLLPPATFTGPRPLLFSFHGTTENADKFITRAKLQDFVNKGFIVVAPNAAGNGTYWPVWDGMRGVGHEADPNKDLELVDSLLKCSAAHYEVDKNRVYGVGHSAGGIFMNRLLRSRSKDFAGGIVGSGVFSLTKTDSSANLDGMFVLVTWGGDNDTYKGTTPSGVNVPSFSFVEQASLASTFYEAEKNVGQAYCRGNDIGHAWLPLNTWFIEQLLAHPKGSATPGAVVLPPLPGGSPAVCKTGAYPLPPLPDVTCGSSTRAGCQQACQLMADCAAENRTVGTALGAQLASLGFSGTSCTGCVDKCEAKATTATDAQALSCFQTRQASASCGPGIDGAQPLIDAINDCCAGKTGSKFCVGLCQTINQNSAAKSFFPTCQAIAP
ncbi:MAG: prolyl oligopeptidase family serine peptidase [Myxococcales bacterium]|nr:prolyl oligopeptidase family serine peptidase [Myxococcales bacterium]